MASIRLAMLHRSAVAVAASVWLGGCGFQPLYGTGQDGTLTSMELAAVAVAEPSTRLGQLIRNEILTGIAPAGSGPERYRLELAPLATDEAAVEALTADVLRRTVRVDVDFRLIEAASGQPLYTGRTFSQASYDRTGTPFANHQARISAEERAAKEVGVDIRTRLAAFFASR